MILWQNLMTKILLASERNRVWEGHLVESQQEPTIEIDVSNAALNHHWYRLPRVLPDGVTWSLLEAENKRKQVDMQPLKWN